MPGAAHPARDPGGSPSTPFRKAHDAGLTVVLDPAPAAASTTPSGRSSTSSRRTRPKHRSSPASGHRRGIRHRSGPLVHRRGASSALITHGLAGGSRRRAETPSDARAPSPSTRSTPPQPATPSPATSARRSPTGTNHGCLPSRDRGRRAHRHPPRRLAEPPLPRRGRRSSPPRRRQVTR